MEEKQNIKGNISIYVAIIAISLLVCTTFAILLYINYDFKSKVPKEIKNNYKITEETYSERKIFYISPKEKKQTDLTILYIHGGSYMGELTKEHWDFCKDLVKDTNATLIIPDYPLAPKYTYKDVFNIMEPLYKEIISKVDINKFIVMGDSAGGGLALALMEKMGEENVQMPSKLILLSPWLDVTMKNEKIKDIEEFDPILIKANLIVAGKLYAGKDGMESYLVNPINGPLEKLKNVTIYTGTYDILNPDTHVLVEKAKNVGIEIILKEQEKAIHTWMLSRHDKSVYKAEETYQDIVKLVLLNKNGE